MALMTKVQLHKWLFIEFSVFLLYSRLEHCRSFHFHITGRQYDKDGNLKQWWNNATINAFRHRAQCIIDQYSRYKVSEVGLYMNGKMTQSENIADNGGLKQAFRVSLPNAISISLELLD